jgi:catechol 2,3-dioxygenase-like lactoylglutathione lyase family enzyme
MKIANAQFWVHDQDEALAFYTETLGWEVRADVTMEAWNFRWLCVGPAGQDDAGLVLMPVPGPPCSVRTTAPPWPNWSPRVPEERSSSRPTTARPPMTNLSARGVTFNDPPTAQAYGIDTSFRRSVGEQHPTHASVGVRYDAIGMVRNRLTIPCCRSMLRRTAA